jgi:hypothetical protein
VRYGHLYKFIVNIYLADKCAEGERRRQKEAKKDLQDAINSFIIH